MASYDELHGLLTNAALLKKTTVAVGVAADLIWNGNDTGSPWDGTNHANRLVWAARSYEHPKTMAAKLLWAVVIANKDTTVEQITGAGDSAIQANVNAVVDIFATS